MSITLIADDQAPLRKVGDLLTPEVSDLVSVSCVTVEEVLGGLKSVEGADLIFLLWATRDLIKTGERVKQLHQKLGRRLVLCMPRASADAPQILQQMGADEIINPAGDKPVLIADRILGHLIYARLIEPYHLEEMWGATKPMRKLYGKVEKYAAKEHSVLIVGETGTGKELIAEALHAKSGGRGKLVKIKCHEIPSGLLGSAIFGHAKGAYTGAVHRKGLLEEASPGGTIFMDEIGDLDAQAQASLLDVVEKKPYRSLGTNRDKQVEARFVFATNRNLQEMMLDGRFREDLFERINVLILKPPPLRERMADIPLLFGRFVEQWNKAKHTSVTVGAGAADELFRHDWPHNVRELRNVFVRAVNEVDADEVITDVIMRESITRPEEQQPRSGNSVWFDPHTDTWDGLEQRAKAAYLRKLIGVAENVEEAIRLSGISRSTLYDYLKKFNIKPKWGTNEPDQT